LSTYLKNKTKKPLLVGITGGIGSGKSTVAKIFESLGVSVFNSDKEAKFIINNEKEIIEKIINEFGDVYNSDGIDSKKIAAIVFNDKNALEKLNAIVHPEVRERFKIWVNKNNNALILIQEAAILIESGAYKNLNKLILVVAPIEERINRVVERDKVSEINVKERIQTQLTDQEKSKYSDFCINNDGKHLVIPQVTEIFEQLKSLNFNN
jgi:dephospho-CoA kinase